MGGLILSRKNVNTTLDDNMYKKIQILALLMGDKKANDLIEEGMIYVLEKYKHILEQSIK